jgi:type IV pilus assembly protein PilO
MESTAFFEKVEKIKMPVRIVILVGTIALFAGLFIWLYYLPKQEEIAKTEKQIAKLTQELNRAKMRAKNYDKFMKEFEQVDAQFKKALLILPDSKEIPALLRTITQLGRESRLVFRLFSPKNERGRELYFEIPVAIRVTGKYHDVATFFDKVSRMSRIVNILNVSMKPTTSLSTMLNTTCTAITYRIKEATATKKGKKKRK